ncbi:MAG TPA: hypothetical protein VJ787_12840 [Thermoleophilia bacterium]|nr:hypothetical protein [Thermoleophilia bacterium]
MLLSACLVTFIALALPTGALAAITDQSVAINGGAPFTDRRHVTLTLSALSTNGSQIWVSVDGDAWKKFKESWPHNLAKGPDGESTVTVQFKDDDNVPVASSDTIVIDTTPRLTGTVPADDAAWYNAPLVLTFADFTDSASGVALFEYQIDGTDAGGWIASISPVEVPVVLDPAVIGDGIHTVFFRATDYAGNVEEVSAGVFRSVARSFDTTAPDVSVTGQDDAWHSDLCGPSP